MNYKFVLIIKRVLFSIFTVALIIGIVSVLSEITRRDESRYSYEAFIEDNTEYDVLFFGSSHVYSGISPMQLWNDYGITSYNLGCSGASIPVSYWMMRNAVEYHKPKIAVLDLFYAESNSKIEGTKEFLHENYDIYPVSLIKIKTVMDLYDKDFNSQFELLFPFSAYHSRWSEIDSDMLNRVLKRNLSHNPEKGANSYTGVVVPDNMVLVPETEKLNEETLGLKYIQMFIDFCKSENIELLLINIPYIASERSQKAANSALELAKENNVKAINMQYAGIVNYNTDMRDNWSHLNPSGEYKVTKYLGEYLVNNFELEDKRNSTENIQWNSWYNEYYSFLVQQISSVDNYKDMLMLLSNENFSATLEYNKVYFTDDVERQLIEQIEDKVKLELREGTGREENFVKISVSGIASKDIITKEFSLDINN